MCAQTLAHAMTQFKYHWAQSHVHGLSNSRNVQNQQGVHQDIECLEGDNQVVYTMIQAREESP